MKIKKIHILLFLLFSFIFLGNINYCLAFEVQLPGMPESPTLPQYIEYFFRWAIGVAGVLAVLSLVFSGIQLIYSAGNPEKISEAKKRATGAIMGLVLLFSSFIILNTINPQLIKLEVPPPLPELKGFYFQAGMVPAPLRMSDLDNIKNKHSYIYWPTTVRDLGGTQINNCNENPEFVYNFYGYKDKNFKNLLNSGPIGCGDKGFLITEINSYILMPETPGVYFYSGTSCMPPKGSNDNAIRSPYTSSIPEWKEGDIKSIRIVNGPDPLKGPFFGLMWFDDPYYKTGDTIAEWWHWDSQMILRDIDIKNNYSVCYNAKFPGTTIWSFYGLASLVNGTSFVIYQWVGYENDGKTPLSAGQGVTLWTKIGFRGGSYPMDAKQMGQQNPTWSKSLESTPINYKNVFLTKEEKERCQCFLGPCFTSGFGWTPLGTYDCLQSIEIKGQYLVLVSKFKDTDKGWYFARSSREAAQVFPVSPEIFGERQKEWISSGYNRSQGTPNIEGDYIRQNSRYIKVIPLAKSFD